jgi:2-dehydro-3-deoxy-D-gluconate 5-dehydrogenase
MKLRDKVAVVTGGATGIGRAVCQRFAAEGARVVVNFAHSGDAARAVAAEIAEQGGEAAVIQADVAVDGEVRSLMRQTTERYGRLDILVNNAGTISRADALEVAEADWDRVINVDLKSAFFLAQAAARHMAGAGGGKIINVVSMLAFQGGIRVPAYTAAKSALAGVTKALANEWAKARINVNAIAPGYFVTDNTKALREDETRSREILARIPAGRWGVPADLGGTAVFLASAASDYVHGAIIPVDGGWLAR